MHKRILYTNRKKSTNYEIVIHTFTQIFSIFSYIFIIIIFVIFLLFCISGERKCVTKLRTVGKRARWVKYYEIYQHRSSAYATVIAHRENECSREAKRREPPSDTREDPLESCPGCRAIV